MGREARANVAQLMKIASLPFPLPFGAFSNKRSMLALANMISAIRFVLEQPATAGETYVVADRTPVSLADMISIMRKASGRKPGLIPVPPDWIGRALRTAGKADILGDGSGAASSPTRRSSGPRGGTRQPIRPRACGTGCRLEAPTLRYFFRRLFAEGSAALRQRTHPRFSIRYFLPDKLGAWTPAIWRAQHLTC